MRKDLEDTFHFNTAISATMELTNMMSGFADSGKVPLGTPGAAVFANAFDALIRLLAPMTPHICEELWERFHPERESGDADSIFRVKLPVANPEYAAAEQMTLVVQINSKIRARIDINAGLPETELEALALANKRIKELIGDKTPRKVIIIKNKLVNIIL